jgi:hypothetical protein
MKDFSEEYLDAKMAINNFYKHTLTGNWAEAERSAKAAEAICQTLQVLVKQYANK